MRFPDFGFSRGTVSFNIPDHTIMCNPLQTQYHYRYLFFMQKRRHRFIMYLHGKFVTTPMFFFCTSKFSCSGGRVEATVYCRCCQVPSKMENQRTGAIASRPLPTLSDSSPLGGGAAAFLAPPRFARSASFHGGAPKSLADKNEGISGIGDISIYREKIPHLDRLDGVLPKTRLTKGLRVIRVFKCL